MKTAGTKPKVLRSKALYKRLSKPIKKVENISELKRKRKIIAKFIINNLDLGFKCLIINDKQLTD